MSKMGHKRVRGAGGGGGILNYGKYSVGFKGAIIWNNHPSNKET